MIYAVYSVVKEYTLHYRGSYIRIYAIYSLIQGYWAHWGTIVIASCKVPPMGPPIIGAPYLARRPVGD